MATIEPSATRPVDRRWMLVVGFYFAAAFSCFAQATSQNALVNFLPTVLMACTAAGWCVVDARQRGRPLVPAMKFIVLIFWSFAVPVYLIATRGWRGLGLVLLNGVALVAIGAAFAIVDTME